MSTTFRPPGVWMQLDGSSADATLPPLPMTAMAQLPDPSMMQLPDPSMMAPVAMPSMADAAMQPLTTDYSQPLSMNMPSLPYMAMPPMTFLQEGVQDMSGVFRSAEAIMGCDCNCDKREQAMMAAQENALRLSAFPEDDNEQPVPWGHAV